MIVIYIIRTLFSCFRHNKDFQKTDVGKGWICYRNSKKTNPDNTKSWLLCCREANKLAKYWQCWPDTYFRFGMFLKDFGNMDKMKSFVPQGAYYRYSADKNLQYHILIDDKILFHNIMTMYNLPVPERFFVFQDKEFRKDGKILSDGMVDEILDKVEDERIFIKRYRGGAASGITIAIKKTDGFYNEQNEKLSAQKIRESYSDSNYIFERQLQQDSVLASFNPDTVNTLRVLTYKDKVVSCSVRMGRKGSYVDNAAKGGVVCSLDIETGCIEDYGLREYDIFKYYEHPDSHIKFKGVYVPQWSAVKELVEKTLKCLPYYNSVGFDVATTVNGPVIIEINSGTGVYVSQMGKETGIANKFK